MLFYFFLIFLNNLITIKISFCQDQNYDYDLALYESQFQGVENFIQESQREEDLSRFSRRCSIMARTESSPFVAFVLLKTSGHFLGMSAIIDRKTLITASKAICSNFHSPWNLLTLAGSLSPWWSKNSQVRRVTKIVTEKYDVALLSIDRPWNLNDRVSPIQIPKKFVPMYTEPYGTSFGVFGLLLGDASMGDKIPKAKIYKFGVQTTSFSGLCNGDILGTQVPFNHTTQVCLFSNISFCKGSLGSPLVGIGEHRKTLLVGVLIYTGCIKQAPLLRAVKISYLDKWIKANSLLGYHLQEV